MLACFGKSNKQKKYKTLPKQERWIAEQTLLRKVADPKNAKPVPIKGVGPAAAAAAAAAARHEVKVTQLEDQLEAHQRDLQATRGDLQHSSRCFDAAMIMVNYHSGHYTQLRDELQTLQAKATETQLKLDEAVASQRWLVESLAERESAREQREAEHQQQLTELASSHREALESRQQELAEARAGWHQERLQQEQELAQRQEERDRDVRELSAQHQQTLASVTAQWERELAESQRRAQVEVEALRLQICELQALADDLSRREEELKTAMGKSTNTKIQVLSSQVKEKEKDIRSLNAVLELKRDEIAELRRDQLELQRLREQNARLDERATKYRAKAEDLEAQLRQRALVERQLSEENSRLRDHQDKEFKANKRLSMENEQLQYKLLTQSDVQGSSGALSRSASFRTARTSGSLVRACSESPHMPSRISPRSPLKCDSLRRRSRRSEEVSPPPPPQVTAVVEKCDSISWVLDLESSEPDASGDWQRGAASSPPSTNGASVGGSESSDSDAADHDGNGVFYRLATPPAAAAASPPDGAPMRDIPESSEGTEI